MPASHVLLRGAGGLLRLPCLRARALSHAKGIGRRPGRMMQYRTAAVLQSMPAAAPIAAPNSGRAVLGGGVADPVVVIPDAEAFEVNHHECSPPSCMIMPEMEMVSTVIKPGNDARQCMFVQ